MWCNLCGRSLSTVSCCLLLLLRVPPYTFVCSSQGLLVIHYRSKKAGQPTSKVKIEEETRWNKIALGWSLLTNN
ncbi:uncharacterized protein LY89DRAFT_679345 [Mollisia scopiformis]|uniref:Secreted protein n=1 Tax=Mollisia scopiformis TaxID=149040 RepID=A0A194XV70_MOLSC|nr:uncharacterized protein LY89DRAFT_679345 [Mollisia scopiformis]KUJ24108.1 hypothetical protein LY89DRAFT_679345 [Mollisia scopiformis]